MPVGSAAPCWFLGVILQWAIQHSSASPVTHPSMQRLLDKIVKLLLAASRESNTIDDLSLAPSIISVRCRFHFHFEQTIGGY